MRRAIYIIYFEIIRLVAGLIVVYLVYKRLIEYYIVIIKLMNGL